MIQTARPGLTGPSLKLLLLAALLLICSFITINGGLYEARQSSAISALNVFLAGEPGTDSWMPMRAASDWLARNLPGTVYQELFFDRNIKFQYPPSSLLLFSALESVGVVATNSLLNEISWYAVLLTAVAVAIQALILMRNSATSYTPTNTAIAMGLAAFVTLTFYPVLKSYGLGQAQTWINACFALAVVCWLLDRRFLAGLLIGLVCMVKPQFALFAIWGLLRRHISFVAGMITIGIPTTAVAVALYGLNNHIDYLNVLQFLTRHGESYFANQSINGLLHRLNTGGFLEWRQGTFPPYVSFIHYVTMLTSAVILAAALFFFRPKSRSNNLLDFLTAALSFTIASPVAWDHHYGILPPIFLALFFHVASMPPSRTNLCLFAVLGGAFLFAANMFPFTFGCDGPGSLIQSYLLIAALALLAIIYQVRIMKGPSQAETAA